MARTSPSRINLKRITDQLRIASRKGDRAALTLAVEQMKTLALSPRYWERYLDLLRHPLARLVDLLVIKQGDRIKQQKGWKLPRPAPAAPSATAAKKRAGRAAIPRPSPTASRRCSIDTTPGADRYYPLGVYRDRRRDEGQGPGRLRRIEGQVQGLQRMIAAEAYCVDILLQVSAVQGALEQVQKLLLGRHVESCVADALRSGSRTERQRKVDELLDVFSRFGGK